MLQTRGLEASWEEAAAGVQYEEEEGSWEEAAAGVQYEEEEGQVGVLHNMG